MRIGIGGLLIFFSVMAHPSMHKIKSELRSLKVLAQKELKFADSLKLIPVAAGLEITFADCKKIEDDIARGYTVHPFQVIYPNGSSSHFMCGRSKGWQKNFMRKISGVSNTGLKYSYVIQAEVGARFGSSWSTYFVNDQNKIIEIQTIVRFPHAKDQEEYSITSMAANGDIYHHRFLKKMKISRTNVEGEETVNEYRSANVKRPVEFFERIVVHPADSVKDYRVFSIDRADKSDWSNFYLPITHAWSGGFYEYAGSYFRFSHNSTSLTTKFRGGKEVCSHASIVRNKKYKVFPAGNAYYKCLNYP